MNDILPVHYNIDSSDGMVIHHYYDFAKRNELTHFFYKEISSPYSLSKKFSYKHSSISGHSKRFVSPEQRGTGAIVVMRFFSQTNGRLYIHIAARSKEECEEEFEKIKRLHPEILVEDDSVEMKFWTLGKDGPEYRKRTLVVPDWDEIRNNYPTEIRDELDILASPDFRIDKGGTLLLFRGPPGQGKTYVIRALARQWKDWCEFNYIVDPENFFGSNSTYLIGTLLDDNVDDDKYQLYVLEDAGEIISTDAKRNTGQGLSRFLNVVDGMIGQGLKNITLLTTNEELGKLHPAVARPGRCYANIEFKDFTTTEAREWLKLNKVLFDSTKGDTPVTLAELYALKEDFHNRKKAKNRVGFGV